MYNLNYNLLTDFERFCEINNITNKEKVFNIIFKKGFDLHKFNEHSPNLVSERVKKDRVNTQNVGNSKELSISENIVNKSDSETINIDENKTEGYTEDVGNNTISVNDLINRINKENPYD